MLFIPQLVMHRSHVFLPTFAVNPEKTTSAVAQDSFSSDWHSLSSELEGCQRRNKRKGTLMLPCLSFTSVFSSFFGSPTCKQRALRSNDRKSPLHRILRCQHRDLTLEIFAAQIGSFWEGNRAEGTSIFAASQEPKTESHTAVVRECENLTPSKRRHRRTRTGQKKYPHSPEEKNPQ